MVKNLTKKNHPNGSGITRSCGLVLVVLRMVVGGSHGDGVHDGGIG